MTLKEHSKHTKLVRPSGGKFGTTELAFLGAPCGVIQDLTRKIAEARGTQYHIGYVDADHGDGAEPSDFYRIYTDKISLHEVQFAHSDLTYDFRSVFADSDLVLVNGNHFPAHQQVVIINAKKEESLSRKLDRLTDVKLILLDEGMSTPFDFIQEHLKDQPNIPILKIDDLGSILSFMDQAIADAKPTIKGLVYAGGQSMRMGRDKGAIDYHGKPQREYVADLLNEVCDEVYLSVQPGNDIDTQYTKLEDSFMGLGPYGGLLSAFRHDPNAAWLALACDVPLVDQQVIKHLIEQRDPSKFATCFHSPVTGHPEPMITIWEPRMYQRLLYFLSIGYSCVRKVLINSDINELDPPSPEVLTNVNTPEEYEQVQQLIHG
ncbi:MAG: NTP transferase domain-containing protein [Cyclobacteriaceae bacterium]